MEPIYILYDIQHFGFVPLVKRAVAELAQRANTKINMEICDGYSLLDRLRTDPNYNFVILHVGQEGEGAHKQAQKCRNLSNAILVAESSFYPMGQQELLQSFDEYVGPLFKEDYLENLLKKYSFISDGQQ